MADPMDPLDPLDPTGPPDDHRSTSTPRRRLRDARMVVTGVTAVLFVWFAVANLQGVRIRFWLASATAPLIVVVVISGVLGAVIAGVASRLARRRHRAGGPDPD